MLVVFACAVGIVGTSVMITNKNTDNAKNKNDSLWNIVNGSDSGDDSNTPTSGPNGEPLVSKTDSQVGKYADIDGDGTVDGIIFADLMVGGSGQWNWQRYTISTIDSSKEYYVSQESYTDVLGGSAEVLTPVGKGNDRFYIMALSDIDSKVHDWYTAAYSNGISDYRTLTSYNFGTGKQNTINMMEKWNNEEFGKQNAGLDNPHTNISNSAYTDMWDIIQDEVNNGWFIPSSAEWAAFADAVNINQNNLPDNSAEKGLNFYWTSSLYDTKHADFIIFSNGLPNMTLDSDCYVRLAKTF